MGNDAKILTGIGLLTVIIVIVAAFTIGNKPTPAQNQEQQTLGESQIKILLRPETHIIKGSNTKVTIVEFGDFECPACGVAHKVTKQIVSDYKGKINYAFREFPLRIHKNSYNAALAAEAAGGQGKFWEMHDKLYEKQEEWSVKKDPIEIFSTYAKDIGLNVDEFIKDIKDKKYDKQIKMDLDDGNLLKIDATPTFFIGNKVFPGVLRYEDFKNQIESQLQKK